IAVVSLALGLGACERGRRSAAPEPASPSGSGLGIEVSAPSAIAPGTNELVVRVRDHTGAPVDDARVSLELSMPMAGMPTMAGHGEVTHVGNGEYLARAELAMAGTWQLAVDAERPSGESLHARGSVRTGSAVVRLESERPAKAGVAPGPGAMPLVRV